MRVLAPSAGTRRSGPAPAGAAPAGPLVAVAAVAAAWMAAQFALFGTDRFLAWDEAVYLSQVAPDVAPLPFHAHRAWGMVAVAAPVAWGGVTAVRVYLTVLSGVALVLAFWPWSRQIGYGAALAAGVFAVTWGPLVLGSELYPNLLVALASVAGAGWFVAHLAGGGRRPLLGVAGGVLAVALLRPFDSVWLAAALVVAMAVVYRRVALAPVAALAAGAAAGWAPWVVEAFVRFGGLLDRFQAAAGRSMGGGDRDNVAQYLNIVEGPPRRVVPDPDVTLTAAVWVAAILVVVAYGVLQGRLPAWRKPTAVALLAGTVLLVPYLTVTGGINIRYLLPSYALVCIPLATALAALWSSAVAGRLVRRTALVALVAAWGVWQVDLAVTNGAAVAAERRTSSELAAVLRDRAGARPCAFASQLGYPSIHFASGCQGARLLLDEPGLVEDDVFDPAELARLGWRVYALARTAPPATSPLTGWPAETVTTSTGGWTLYEHPRSAGR